MFRVSKKKFQENVIRGLSFSFTSFFLEKRISQALAFPMLFCDSFFPHLCMH